MQRKLIGYCFLLLLLGQVPLHAQIHRAFSLTLVDFENSKWTRANPDNAGCVNYTANMNGARASIKAMPGGDEATLTAQQNQVVRICRQTMHSTDGALGAVQQIVPGYVVAFTEVVIFQTNRWNRAGPNVPFVFTYTANANGSTVNFKVPPPLNKHLLFTHNNNSVNFIIDNILHLDNATDRQEVRPGPCPKEEEKNVCELELENCGCELIDWLINIENK